jgi:uncharacterized membrane protein
MKPDLRQTPDPEGPPNKMSDYSKSKGTGKSLDVMASLRVLIETTQRAFVEFLTIPTFVIVAFLLLALVTFVLDKSRITATAGSQPLIWEGLFSDPEAARNFLGVIASSIITVTSITLSLLLIAVQQGAASLTSLVFDQFLRRRTNQLYFGFFIGLALYALIVLASINPAHQPIYGVALAGLLTIAALYMLIVLIYTTINQMRPVVIIKSIHDHTLRARERQRELLRSTRRLPRLPAALGNCITADRSGFMTAVNFVAIDKATAKDAEVIILVSIGEYVAFGDPVLEIRSVRAITSEVKRVIESAIILEGQRDLDSDPAFGIEQLETIGWTSISTAKSNPDPGLLTIWNLRDLLSRWLASDVLFGEGKAVVPDPTACVVYNDNLPERLMQAFESLVVVASESMQHQSAAQIYRALATLFPRLGRDLQQRADDLILRSVSGLGDQILTHELDVSLALLVGVLRTSGRTSCADAVETARSKLGETIGQLNSRSTRTQIQPVKKKANPKST